MKHIWTRKVLTRQRRYTVKSNMVHTEKSYFYAFVDPSNEPAKQAAVEIFGKGISSIVGLQKKTTTTTKRSIC